MTFKIKALIATAVFAASGSAFAQTTLLNGSYDVAREFYKDYNAAFIAHYKKTTGKDVKIDQSHAGSSAVARSVADGLDADVVTMNTSTDIDFLANAGVVAKDWNKKFPDNAAPTTSTMLFLTRNGNPKAIKDWDDLVKPGTQVIVVTHLPQVAACADHHLVVSKQQTGTHTSSSVAPLHDEPRVAEIARMLGGERASATSLAHAREMLGGGATHTAPPARTQPKKAAKVTP